MSSRAASAGASIRRSRSARTVSTPRPFATAATRNGNPAVAAITSDIVSGSVAVSRRPTSGRGHGPRVTRGCWRSRASINALSSGRCSRGSVATITVAVGSATSSVRARSSASSSSWASSTTVAGEIRLDTVIPLRRRMSRATVSVVDLPVPMPPVTRSLAGAVGSSASAPSAACVGGDSSGTVIGQPAAAGMVGTTTSGWATTGTWGTAASVAGAGISGVAACGAGA